MFSSTTFTCRVVVYQNGLFPLPCLMPFTRLRTALTPSLQGWQMAVPFFCCCWFLLHEHKHVVPQPMPNCFVTTLVNAVLGCVPCWYDETKPTALGWWSSLFESVLCKHTFPGRRTNTARETDLNTLAEGEKWTCMPRQDTLLSVVHISVTLYLCWYKLSSLSTERNWISLWCLYFWPC